MRRSVRNALAMLGGGTLAGAALAAGLGAGGTTAASPHVHARLSGFEALPGGLLLSGSRLPTVHLGTTGDFYFRTGTDQLFGPKDIHVVHPWGAVGIPLAQARLRGPAGPAGPKGPSGSQGPKGTPGTSILSGGTAPTTQGTTGDFYLDTSTETLYGPKASGRWPATGASLVGSPGTSGAQTTVVRRATFTVAAAGTATGIAACASGYAVTGGGYTSTAATVSAQDDAPVFKGTAWEWQVSVANATATKKATVTAYAVCTKGAARFT
ncbi:MAG: hypothetical protein ACRDXC_14515 [Acidimicrobiales bacterium]